MPKYLFPRFGCRLKMVSVRPEIGMGRWCLLALLPLLSIGIARAEEDDRLRFDFYGTLGFSHDDSANLAPVRDLSQRPRRSNQTNDSWVMDSRLGLQASYAVNPWVDLMTQAVWREQADISLDSYLDWAFINLHPTPAFDVRLGRVGYDVFLMSDHRNLGYAYPWVRPPIEFYGWIPMYSVNGGDMAYTLEEGTARWRFKAQAGHAGLKFPMGSDASSGPDYDFKSDNVWSLTAAWESDPWRIKGGYSQIVLKTDAPILAPLQAGLETVARAGLPGVSAEAAALRDDLTYQDVTLRYVTLGVAYDDGVWLGQAEWGRVTTTADMVSNGNMAYLGMGRRFGDWTPFVLLSGVRSTVPVRQTSADWNLSASLSGLQASAVSVLNSTRFDQETESLGVRWDFNSHLAFKVQGDSTLVHPYGYGLWYVGTNDRTHVDTRINLLSATMDFVF
ncbi:MAG: hypothetical protein HQL87_16720 [Magnetococcales bacterium]|nr:hypothetical protein [Magnetococcales bacterium]